MNILFVCTANVSRSFLAEMLFNHEIETRNLPNVQSGSAGLFALPGHPPDPKMVDYLSDRGISVKRHAAARQMTEEDVSWADLILVMEKEHRRVIEELWPEAGGKVDLLGKFLSEEGIADDVVDPYRRSSYHYHLTQSQISLAVKSLVERLLSGQT